MIITALDPGTTHTAYVHYDTAARCLHGFGIVPNELVYDIMRDVRQDALVVEMVASYGMPVGVEVFETVVWIGKFEREWEILSGKKAGRVYRREEKQILCHDSRAKDANIRQALIDMFGPPGTKKNPGTLYGVSKDVWSALAVAVTYTIREGLHA